MIGSGVAGVRRKSFRLMERQEQRSRTIFFKVPLRGSTAAKYNSSITNGILAHRLCGSINAGSGEHVSSRACQSPASDGCKQTSDPTTMSVRAARPREYGRSMSKSSGAAEDEPRECNRDAIPPHRGTARTAKNKMSECITNGILALPPYGCINGIKLMLMCGRARLDFVWQSTSRSRLRGANGT